MNNQRFIANGVKIVAVIPSHLASVRFPGKILYQFAGLPMIEHVRRRALLCRELDDVYVSTCDQEIADAVRGYGGNVIMTSDEHRTGTDRVAEAVSSIDCTHVIVLQGDEPLLLPEDLGAFIQGIKSTPDASAWNATGPIEKSKDLDTKSIVKCVVAPSGRILLGFRRTPCFSAFEQQKTFVRKIFGLIAFQKDFILQIAATPATPYERAESIEQSRILETGNYLQSIPVQRSYVSVNEPHEADLVKEYLENDPIQKDILKKIL